LLYLYSLYHPKVRKITINAHKKARYRDIARALRRKGYIASSPRAVGALSKVALRRYKGIKTLLVEIKDYRTLQIKYRTAIRTYNASKIEHIKTLLPHTLIANYFNTYRKRATTNIQKEQLKRIANKLHLNTPAIKQVKQEMKQVIQEEEEVQAVLAQEVPEPIVVEEPLPSSEELLESILGAIDVKEEPEEYSLEGVQVPAVTSVGPEFDKCMVKGIDESIKLISLAEAMLGIENYSEALKYAKKALKYDDTRLKAATIVANAYSLQGEYSKALDFLFDLLKKEKLSEVEESTMRN
jgi:tetratricopeptide (TPR) repeat protein